MMKILKEILTTRRGVLMIVGAMILPWLIIGIFWPDVIRRAHHATLAAQENPIHPLLAMPEWHRRFVRWYQAPIGPASFAIVFIPLFIWSNRVASRTSPPDPRFRVSGIEGRMLFFLFAAVGVGSLAVQIIFRTFIIGW